MKIKEEIQVKLTVVLEEHEEYLYRWYDYWRVYVANDMEHSSEDGVVYISYYNEAFPDIVVTVCRHGHYELPHGFYFTKKEAMDWYLNQDKIKGEK